jgi:hypothetical protein
VGSDLVAFAVSLYFLGKLNGRSELREEESFLLRSGRVNVGCFVKNDKREDNFSEGKFVGVIGV